MTSKLSLAQTHPEVAAQAFGWDPGTVTSGSAIKRSWICTSSHVTETRIADKCKGIICAICSGQQVLEGFNDLKTVTPKIAKEADGWDPTTVTSGSSPSERTNKQRSAIDHVN